MILIFSRDIKIRNFCRPSRPLSPVPQFKTEDNEEEDTSSRNEKKITEKPKQSYTQEIKSQTIVANSFNVLFTRTGVLNSLEQPDMVNEIDASGLYQTLDNMEEKKEGDSVDTESFKGVNYDIMGDVNIMTNLSLISELDLTACGTPLRIFTDVSLC